MSVRGARASDQHVKNFTALLMDPYFNKKDIDIDMVRMGHIDPYTSMDAIDASMEVCEENMRVPGPVIGEGDVFAENYDHVFLAQLPP